MAAGEDRRDRGLPADKAAALQKAFEVEAAQREIPVREKTANEAVGLRGEFRASPEGGAVDYR